jgi:chemotaxis protein MotA
MLFAVGMIVVMGSVVGGFLAAGGHLHVLWQPFEYLIIFGAALGAFVIANPKGVLIGTAKGLSKLVGAGKYDKKTYLELLNLLYAIFRLAKIKGDLALESHVDNPTESDVFARFPLFLKNHEAVEFVCDYLRLLTLGSNKSHELETVMEAEIEAHRAERHHISSAMQAAADGLPALGIVAAVLGIIHTMGAITEPPEVLGEMIGAALVGTFTGVLAAYGVVAPMAKSLENKFEAESNYLECIKMALLAHVQGYAPQVSVELARKTLHGEVRPSFVELDEAIQNSAG